MCTDAVLPRFNEMRGAGGGADRAGDSVLNGSCKAMHFVVGQSSS